jgi:hypothetical protein
MVRLALANQARKRLTGREKITKRPARRGNDPVNTAS